MDDNINAAFQTYRAQPGEAEQAVLIRHMRKFAYALVWSKLHQNRPDIVNYAVWKALNKLDSFRGESQFGTWFRVIVENLCRRTLRKEKSRNEVELDPALEPSDEAHMEQVLYSGLLDLVEDSQDRELLSKIVEGYEPGEVAQLLRMNPATVRTRLRRLRRRLREATV